MDELKNWILKPISIYVLNCNLTIYYIFDILIFTGNSFLTGLFHENYKNTYLGYFVDAAIETLPSLIYVFANIYEIKRFLVSLKYCLRLKSRFSFIFQKKKFWHKDKLVVCDHEACNLCETTNTVKKFDLERF